MRDLALMFGGVFSHVTHIVKYHTDLPMFRLVSANSYHPPSAFIKAIYLV